MTPVAEVRREARQFALRPGEQAFDQPPARFVFDVPEVLANPAGAARIPFQVALRRGMGEPGQRGVHGAEQRAEAAQQFRRVRAHARQHPPGHPRQQPHEVRPALRVGDRDHGFAIDRVLDTRKRQLGRPRGQVRERGVLELDDARVLLRVRDLQHVAPVAGILQHDVLIALARQRFTALVDAVVPAADGLDLVEGERRRAKP